MLRLPRPWDHSRSIEHVKKSLHAKYGGLPSSIRREKAKIHLSFYVCFVMFCIFEVVPSSTPQIPLPTIVKSFQDILFDHRNDIEHILYGYISRKHEFRRRTFSNFYWFLLWFLTFWSISASYPSNFPPHDR